LSIALRRTEQEIADSLTRTGLSAPVSVLAVVMATRAHARPEDEVVEIIRQYPRLEDVNIARQAVRDLLRLGWLESSESYEMEFTHQAADLREKIEARTGIPGTAERLYQMTLLESPVKIVGAMTDQVVYSSFLDILGRAQNRIRLPMLATTPYPQTVRILRERAEAGVGIQLLLGSPGLVANWRGEKMRTIAAERLANWQRQFARYPNVEVRISRHADDMRIATCVGVDDTFVRLDVYDPVTQRSLQGVMIEIESSEGMKLNLVQIFFDLFDAAWRRALAPGRLASTRWFLRRFWKLELGAIVTAFAFIPIGLAGWTAVLVGLGTGIMAPSLIDEIPRIRWALREWRRS
jgi:hypothetical protein